MLEEKNKAPKKVGIIGGMGPLATVDLFEKILEYTDAETDQDHIHIIIDCNSGVPDRTAAIIHSAESPLPMIRSSALRLEAAGADFLIIACNTSHYYLKELHDTVKIPFLNMIEETAKFIKEKGYKAAIILGSEGSMKVGIYKKTLERLGLTAIYPDSVFQQEITNVIYKGIKAGEKEWNVDILNRKIKEYETKYNAVTVLGCTELPVAQKQYKMIGHFIDPSLILALATIKYAGYKVKKEQ